MISITDDVETCHTRNESHHRKRQPYPILQVMLLYEPSWMPYDRLQDSWCYEALPN